MLTPAQEHFQRVMAQRAGLSPEQDSPVERTAHEQVLHMLRLAQSRLSGIQSRQTKAELKKEILPQFAGWIEGTLEGDRGRPDEVITTLMVWAVDCGDLAMALRLGAYVVRHGLSLSDNFGRSAATTLTEEICNPVLTLATTQPDANLHDYIVPLDTLADIVDGQDMPDEVRAKLCKARAFARRADEAQDSMTLSLELLRTAMQLNPNAGVKREIAALTRALKKLPDQPAAESVPTTTDAPLATSRKTTRTKTASKTASKTKDAGKAKKNT